MFNNFDNLLETLIVGSLAYLAFIVLLRISGKRTISKWSSFDFMVTIAFGSILSTVLLSGKTSLVQGIVGFALLAFLQSVITGLAAHSSIFQKLFNAQPTLLLYQGALRTKILKKERVTEGEVLAALRSSGLASVEDAAAVVLETNGSFSVIQELNNGFGSTLRDVKGYDSIATEVYQGQH